MSADNLLLNLLPGPNREFAEMTITKKKTKRGLKYKAQVCVDGQRPSKTFHNHLDAVRWEQETIERLQSGLAPEGKIAPDDMIFLKGSDRFIIEIRTNASAGSLNSYHYAQKQLIQSFGDDILMSQITPQAVSSHVLRRMSEDGVGPSSIRQELSFLRLVFTKANEWGVKYPSPERDIKRPANRMKSREERLDRVIKPNELPSLLEESQKRRINLYYFLTFLLYTGMRPSEAAHLYWKRLPVKKEREAIKTKRHVGYVDQERGGFTKVGTKTEKRFVPCHPEAKKIIEHVRSQTPNDQLLVFLPNSYVNKDRPYLVYRRAMRTTIDHTKMSDSTPLRKDIDFYSFRHTCRSAMESCGVQTAMAETIIGHNDKSFKFTYIHNSDEELINEIKKLKYPGLILDLLL